jgi:DNA polymerase-3 subunit beta
MKFNITHKDLVNGMGVVSRLASGKMPLPILNNILIQGEDNSLIFSVTDLELGIEVKLPAQVAEPSKFTVPARLLNEFVQSTHEKSFEGKVDNAALFLKTDHSQVTIKGLDASEFPGLPFVDQPATFHLNPKEAKEAIDGVLFATAVDETRPALAGVYWVTSEQILIMAATDSYRLAERRIKAASKITSPCSAIVPKKTLLELSRMLTDEVGDISVFVGDNQIQFAFGSVRLVSRLIEGTYPNYQAIIPKDHQTRITANHSDLVSGLKTVGLFARDSGNTIKLIVVPGKGMTLQSLADQRGEAINQVTAIVEGEEATIVFNVKYLLDALSVIHAENVFLELNGAVKPVIMRPTNTKEYFSLVMPLKID